jgi:hypothetical protein
MRPVATPSLNLVFDEEQRRISGEHHFLGLIAARDVEIVERLVDERKAIAAEKEGQDESPRLLAAAQAVKGLAPESRGESESLRE